MLSSSDSMQVFCQLMQVWQNLKVDLVRWQEEKNPKMGNKSLSAYLNLSQMLLILQVSQPVIGNSHQITKW